MYRLRTLGQLALSSGDGGDVVVSSSKPLLVLAYLCATTEREERRDRVASLFWPDADDDGRARQSLRQALYSLGRRTEEPLVEALDDGRLVVVEDHLEVDLWDLDRATAEERYRDVVRLYRGPFLVEFRGRIGGEVESWMEVEDERLRTGVRAALHGLTAAALAEERADDAVRWSRRLVEMNPLLESAQLARVRALAATGRPTDALQAYETYRALLREALGDEPGRELREEADRIRSAVFRLPEVVPAPTLGAPEPTPAAGGPEPAPTPDAPERSQTLPPAAWGGVAGALVVLAVVGIVARDPGAGGSVESVPTRAPVLVTTAERPEEWHELRLDEAEPEPRPIGVRRRGLPSPDGSRVAVRVARERGLDIELHDLETGERTLLVDRPDDDLEEAWSPDGRYLLIHSGELDPETGTYVRRPWIVDVETGERRALSLGGMPEGASMPSSGLQATWSPRGVHVVFSASSRHGRSDEDLYVTTFAGDSVRNLTGGPGRDLHPSWSPDGRRIAFASDRSGSEGIYLLDLRREEVRALVDEGYDETHPVWVSGHQVAYLRHAEGSVDLWTVDLASGGRAPVTDHGGLGGHLARASTAPGTISPLEVVTITPSFPRVGPGQWLTLEVRGRDAAGEPVPAARLPWRWSVSDSSLVELREPGVVRVLASGEAAVVASAGGWRADTLEIRSTSPATVDRPVLLEEDWSGGIRSERWHPMGDPPPRIVRRDGPGGDTVPALLNNGDAHFDSGVRSARAFGTEGGLTVEVWGRVSLDAAYYQDFRVVLDADPAEPGTATWSQRNGVAMLQLGARPEGPRMALAAPQPRSGRLPVPESTGRWARYALQIGATGTRRVLVDGRIVWQSPEPLDLAEVDSVYVTLGNRSLDTEILHGPLRVWRGTRYVFPGE